MSICNFGMVPIDLFLFRSDLKLLSSSRLVAIIMNAEIVFF